MTSTRATGGWAATSTSTSWACATWLVLTTPVQRAPASTSGERVRRTIGCAYERFRMIAPFKRRWPHRGQIGRDRASFCPCLCAPLDGVGALSLQAPRKPLCENANLGRQPFGGYVALHLRVRACRPTPSSAARPFAGP